MAAKITFANDQGQRAATAGRRGPIRVLVVDDSAFARVMIGRRIDSDAGFEVVGEARDGLDAIEKVGELKPDVVTMDVTMPRLDGLGAVKRIMAECPTPIVMLSALTEPGAHVTLEALELGAVDFFLKPSVAAPAGATDAQAALLEKLRVAAGARLTPLGEAPKRRRSAVRHVVGGKYETVLVIGASTGGPKALATVLPRVPADIQAGILIVQHMPRTFTASLASRLNAASAIDVREAKDGDLVTRGRALLAPGGYHLTVDGAGIVHLNTDAEVHGVRPSVDVTMTSVAKHFPRICRAVVLTGMGADGQRGCGLIKSAGGRVVVEHESTCAVYGMPRAVVDAGHADQVVPLRRVAREIERMCNLARSEMSGV